MASTAPARLTSAYSSSAEAEVKGLSSAVDPGALRGRPASVTNATAAVVVVVADAAAVDVVATDVGAFTTALAVRGGVSVAEGGNDDFFLRAGENKPDLATAGTV